MSQAKLPHEMLYKSLLGNTSLSESVLVVIVGHYSINGTCEDHFHYEDGVPRHNHIIVDCSEQMMHYIIVQFSLPNGTILDCTKNSGIDVIFNNVHVLYTTAKILGCASVVAIHE